MHFKLIILVQIFDKIIERKIRDLFMSFMRQWSVFSSLVHIVTLVVLPCISAGSAFLLCGQVLIYKTKVAVLWALKVIQ